MMQEGVASARAGRGKPFDRPGFSSYKQKEINLSPRETQRVRKDVLSEQTDRLASKNALSPSPLPIPLWCHIMLWL